MAKSTPETILLKGSPVCKEGITDEKLKPGHIIERGGTKDIQKVDSANEFRGKMIAIENDLVGCGVDDEYAVDDTVLFIAPYRGCEVLVRIAAGANVAEGAYVTCAADGTGVTGTVANAFGIALEAKDNSTGTAETFLRVEII